jgi:hypothetical protein
VSVLPQLQQELSAAHARRRRRLPRVGFGFGGASVALAGAVALAVVVVAVVLVQGRPTEPASPPSVVYRGFASDFYAAGGSLYAITSDQPEVSPSVGEPPHLVRIDPSSGHVAAQQRLVPPPTPQGQPVPGLGRQLLAAGSLWVTATDSQQTWLWRLDPLSLAVRALTVLPGGGTGPEYSGSLAVAGGRLWVVNRNTLVRVSLRTGRVTASRRFSRAIAGLGNAVAADQSGRTLVLTVAGPKTDSHVELLNPDSGVAIATSPMVHGDTQDIAGVIDGGAWINGFTSTDGPVRVDLRTLKVTGTVGRFPLTARVFDGIVEISRYGKGPMRCVDPVTGRTLAPLPDVVAAEGRTAYVTVQRRGIPEIHRETLDPRCLAAP